MIPWIKFPRMRSTKQYTVYIYHAMDTYVHGKSIKRSEEMINRVVISSWKKGRGWIWDRNIGVF